MTVTGQPTGVGRIRSWVWVACGNGGCAYFGIQRQVMLRRVSLGVVEVPHSLLCEGCGMSMSFSVWEAEVPKIHVGREPTHREDIAAAVAAVVAEVVNPVESVEVDADAAPAEAEETAEAPAAAKAAKKSTPRKKAS